MEIKYINIGTTANDGTGDSLRSAGQKINENLQELETLEQLVVLKENLGEPENAPLINSEGFLEAIITVRDFEETSPSGVVYFPNEIVVSKNQGVPTSIRVGDGETPNGIPVGGGRSFERLVNITPIPLEDPQGEPHVLFTLFFENFEDIIPEGYTQSIFIEYFIKIEDYDDQVSFSFSDTFPNSIIKVYTKSDNPLAPLTFREVLNTGGIFNTSSFNGDPIIIKLDYSYQICQPPGLVEDENENPMLFAIYIQNIDTEKISGFIGYKYAGLVEVQE